MTQFHPQFLSREGQNQFVILPYEEYVQMQEVIEDLQDLLTLREAKRSSEGKPRLTQDQVEQRYGITPAAKSEP